MSANKNVLVAYFSHSGNTRRAAEIIHNIVGGTLYEIKGDNRYPNDYHSITVQAQKEQQQKFRPNLVNPIPDIEKYDTIILGNPCWWGTFPMATFTFLEKFNFDGKRILPFVTHEGSGLGSEVEDIKRTCPTAKVADGIPINGPRASSYKSNIEKWLKQNGL